MTTMIEKLAQAITDELARQDGYDLPAWKLENGLKLAWLDQGEVDMGLVARVVLTALLEPSEGMVGAGADHLFASSNDNWSLDAREVFTAMIQAALDEREG